MTASPTRWLIPLAVLCLAAGARAGQDSGPARLGIYTDRLIVANQTLVLSPGVQAAVERIGGRLAAASGNPLPRYTYRILINPQVNAFSTDDGFVYVTTGLLDTCRSADELAAILAREIVHTNGSHQSRFIREEQRKRSNEALVSGLLGLAATFGAAYIAARQGDDAFFQERGGAWVAPYPSYGNSIAAAFASRMLADLGPGLADQLCAGLTETAIRGYGQKLELEADAGALPLLRRAGFDPRAMLTVLERLKAVRSQLPDPAMLPVSSPINAAPGLEKRMERIRTLLAEGNQ